MKKTKRRGVPRAAGVLQRSFNRTSRVAPADCRRLLDWNQLIILPWLAKFLLIINSDNFITSAH
jgi:hypothetical protein